SSPAIEAGGLAVFGGDDGFVYGVAPGAGPPPKDAGADADLAGDAGDDADASAPPARALLKVGVDGPVTSSPVIAKDGAIVVATSNGKVVAVRADGSTKWSVTTGGTTGASPAIGRDGRIYAGGGANKLYAL